ncbi:hypothetical protein EIP86_006576 [Pleurotus ostreatoroseus]|nr:hypothetical protein EIP86_006576 [Pleurotus ostreatoroseus]
MCQLKAIRRNGHVCCSWLHRKARGLIGRPFATNSESTEEHAGSLRRYPLDDTLDAFDEYLNIQIFKKLSKSVEFVTQPKAASKEEDDLRKAEVDDVTIFRNIDHLFLDDTLLARMLDILMLRPRPLNDMLRFVVAVVQSRLELCIPGTLSEVSPKVLWPWTLTRSVRSALVDALAESMCSQLQHGSSIYWRWLSDRDSDWSASFAFVVLHTDPYEIPSAVPRLIHASTQCAIKHLSYSPLDGFSYQMRTLSLKLLKAEEAVRCLAYVVHVSFIDPRGSPDRRTYRLLLDRLDTLADEDNVIQPSQQRISVLVEAAGVVLHKYTFEQTESQDTFPSDFEDLLEFVLDAIPLVEERHSGFDEPLVHPSHSEEPSLSQVLTDLFTTPHTAHSLLDFFVRNLRHVLLPTDSSYRYQFFPNLLWHENFSQEESILVLSNCASFFSKAAVSTRKSNRCALLRVCLLVYTFRTPTDDEVRAGWHRHARIADASPTPDIGSLSDPRSHQKDGGLSDMLERPPPQSESVTRNREEGVEEIRHAPSHVHEAKGDEADDAPREATVGSSAIENVLYDSD